MNETVANLTDRLIRVWQVAVNGCQMVRSGCGVSTRYIDIQPFERVVVRTVVRDGPVSEWKWNAMVRSRWRPPPDGASYDVTVPRGPNQRLGLRLALASFGYRVHGPTATWESFAAINVPRRLTIYVEERVVSPDSATIHITAERYTGRTSGGRIGARRNNWKPVTTADTESVASLQSTGERIRAFMNMGPTAMKDSAASSLAFPWLWAIPRASPAVSGLTDLVPAKVLANGESRVCRVRGVKPQSYMVVDLIKDEGCPAATGEAQEQYNAFVIVELKGPAIGTQINACAAYANLFSGGWDEIEWISAPGRCPLDGRGVDPHWPNVVVVQRRY